MLLERPGPGLGPTSEGRSSGVERALTTPSGGRPLGSMVPMGAVWLVFAALGSAIAYGVARWLDPRWASRRVRTLSAVAVVVSVAGATTWTAAAVGLHLTPRIEVRYVVRGVVERVHEPTRGALATLPPLRPDDLDRDGPFWPAACAVVEHSTWLPRNEVSAHEAHRIETSAYRCPLGAFRGSNYSYFEDVAGADQTHGAGDVFEGHGWSCEHSAASKGLHSAATTHMIYARVVARFAPGGRFAEYRCPGTVACFPENDPSCAAFTHAHASPSPLYLALREVRDPVVRQRFPARLLGEGDRRAASAALLALLALALIRWRLVARPAAAASPATPYRAPQPPNDDEAAARSDRHAHWLLAVIALHAAASIAGALALWS